MKYLTIFLFIFSLNLHAQEREGDLNLPVSDLPEVERQEEELPPTINEVEMKEKKKPSRHTKKNQRDQKKKTPKHEVRL